MMSWQRKQYDRNGKPVKRVFKGEKDWSREDKEKIREYQEKYGDQRKAG